MAAAVEDYDGSGGYEDSLHPPAIVHIPEEFDPEDPASPANIDSPLSSPPNSPNAWGAGAMDAGDDDGDGNNNGNNDVPINTQGGAAPLELPQLNHHKDNEGGAGEPFDEGGGNHSFHSSEGQIVDDDEGMVGQSTKAAALNSIRDERKQRKMRRMQQFMVDNIAEAVPPQNQARSNNENEVALTEEQQQQIFLQQKLEQLQIQQREEEEEGEWNHHSSNGDDSNEDQPFDSAQDTMNLQPHEISPQKGPQQLTLHVVPDSPEDQPFDAAPIHRPATSRSNPYPDRAASSHQQQHLQSEIKASHSAEHLPQQELPSLAPQQQNFASSKPRDMEHPTSEAGVSMISNMSTSLQRRLQRYMQTSVGNSNNNDANNVGQSNNGDPLPNGPSIVKTNANRPVSDIAASLSAAAASGGGTNNATKGSSASRQAMPYSPTPGAIPPPVIARQQQQQQPTPGQEEAPIQIHSVVTHNNRSASPGPALARAASPLVRPGSGSILPANGNGGGAQRSNSKMRERADSNNSLPFEDEMMGGGGRQHDQQQQQGITPPVVDLTGYREDVGAREKEDIPDDERLPPHPRALRRSNSRARGGRRQKQQQQQTTATNIEQPHIYTQTQQESAQIPMENVSTPSPTVRDVLSFDPFAAAKSRVSSRSESQILLDPRAVETPSQNPQQQQQPYPQQKKPAQQEQPRRGRNEFHRSSSLQGSSLSPRPHAASPSSHYRRSSSFNNDVAQQDPTFGNSMDHRNPSNPQKPISLQQTMQSSDVRILEMETTNEEKKWGDADLLPMDESPLQKQKKDISRPRSRPRQAQLSRSAGAEPYIRRQAPQQQKSANSHQVPRRPVSPPKQPQHSRSNTAGSIEQETKHKEAPKMAASPISRSFSPNFIEDKRNNSFEAPMDDDASWLARRVQKREPQSQNQMDEDASWLAERVGSPDQNSLDEDASWLAGRLGGGNDGPIPKSITARQKSDAPGTTPSPKTKKSSLDPSTASSAERKPKQTKTLAKPKTAPSASANRGSPTRSLGPSEAVPTVVNKAEAKPFNLQRSAPNAAANRSSPASARSSPPEPAPPAVRTLDPKSLTHRKVSSTDDSSSPMRAQQPMRRVQSDVPSTQHVMNASFHQQEYSPSLVDQSEFVSQPHASDRGTNDETSASQASADIGSFIESIDEMVKDLETSRVEDTNSVTQATSTLSSNNSEKQTPGTPKHAFKGKPILVQPINNDIGIPKGDVMISLLSESTDTPWSTRIEEAIWRCRIMRQHCDTKWLKQKLERKPNTPSHGRTSVVVDVDDARVVGGIESVAASQKAALEHLKYDDLEDALALYEDIIEAYYGHFENCLKQNTTVEQLDDQVLLFNNYIGSCLHNIGLVYLLLKRFKEAYSHFERAATKRSATLGVGHTDHLASHVKAATCHIALGRHTEAVVILEECLILSKEGARSISDQRQVAEINNNLACLYYGLGNHEKAGSYFRESFEAQTVALEHSLYAGARFSCHSATLNLAVTKANIGFLALVARNHEVAIEALEYSVHNQQLLLRDAHTTLIATMDHLVVAQIFAGNKDKAIRLLRRMFHMQSDAFGSTDERCLATSKKLTMLEEAEPNTFENLDQTNNEGFDDGTSSNASDKKRGNIFKLFKSMAVKK